MYQLAKFILETPVFLKHFNNSDNLGCQSIKDRPTKEYN